MKPMEPAYWEMRRIEQRLRSTSRDLEHAHLEVAPPMSHPTMVTDPETPLFPETAGIPWLAPECGRTVSDGRWRVLRPVGGV